MPRAKPQPVRLSEVSAGQHPLVDLQRLPERGLGLGAPARLKK